VARTGSLHVAVRELWFRATKGETRGDNDWRQMTDRFEVFTELVSRCDRVWIGRCPEIGEVEHLLLGLVLD
jgi:hypothetical protein